MTHEAQRAIANAITLELKKDGLSQRQSGDWQLRFTVAAIDMDQRVTSAPMGTRYQCVLVEINDDESPVDHKGQEREKWRDLGPTRQAGIRCADPVFWAFLVEEDYSLRQGEEAAVSAVCQICEITSRKDLGKPSRIEARQRWHDLDNHYQAWKAAQ